MKPQIILIQGITGAGKSTILDFLRLYYSDEIVVGTKLTNRNKRDGDNSWEFKFLDEIPANETYLFESVGNLYAVDEAELKKVISEGKTYAITLTNLKIAKKLKTDFKTLVIYVYRSMSEKELKLLLSERRELNEKNKKLRVEEFRDQHSIYRSGLDVYDHVILNIGTRDDLCEQVVVVLATHGFNRKI